MVAHVGGNWNNGSNAGLFMANLNNTSSNSNHNVGARLLVVVTPLHPASLAPWRKSDRTRHGLVGLPNRREVNKEFS